MFSYKKGGGAAFCGISTRRLATGSLYYEEPDQYRTKLEARNIARQAECPTAGTMPSNWSLPVPLDWSVAFLAMSAFLATVPRCS